MSKSDTVVNLSVGTESKCNLKNLKSEKSKCNLKNCSTENDDSGKLLEENWNMELLAEFGRGCNYTGKSEGSKWTEDINPMLCLLAKGVCENVL